MGNVSPVDGIWTPDEGDNLDPEVWSATMAASIEEGIGVRLAKQEARAGAKVSINAPVTVTLAGITFPVTVSSGYEWSYGNYINGMGLTGGILEIQTSGLYLIIGSVICDFVADRTPMNISLNVNASVATSEALETSPTTFASKTLTTTAYLVAGDTVYMRAGTAAGIDEDLPVNGANLNVIMLYAT
jgi:hypothetical protein